MPSSLRLPLIGHVVGGEDRVDAVPRKHQKCGLDDLPGGVGRDACDGEDCHGGAEPEV